MIKTKPFQKIKNRIVLTTIEKYNTERLIYKYNFFNE